MNFLLDYGYNISMGGKSLKIILMHMTTEDADVVTDRSTNVCFFDITSHRRMITAASNH